MLPDHLNNIAAKDRKIDNTNWQAHVDVSQASSLAYRLQAIIVAEWDNQYSAQMSPIRLSNPKKSASK